MGFYSLIMAWSVDTIFGFVKWLTNKNQSGAISATDFFYLWNSEQKATMSDLLGRFQPQSNNKTGPNIGLIQDKTLLQKLAPFTKPVTLTITTGNSDKPLDFVYHMGLRIAGFDVTHINHDQIASVNNSVIDPPAIASNKYYYVEYEDYYSFLPNTVTSASLDYIGVPDDIVWGYILDSENRQVYSIALSTQPAWDDLTIVEITKRTLKSLSVHFKDSDFSQFGQSNIVTGD